VIVVNGQPASGARRLHRGDRVTVTSARNWSVDPADWQPGVSANQLVQRVLTAARPGAIVLLHDGGGDRSATVAALPTIIDGLRRLGLALTVVSG
jgi:peptidoglycan/xylan/chitin deacetylase (PgdA/CDA1 family)